MRSLRRPPLPRFSSDVLAALVLLAALALLVASARIGAADLPGHLPGR